jgi:hypothetical protein
MNWKIIFQLSVFGLIMAFGTVSLIPEMVEPAFWLVIFVVCAWVIAKACTRRYFLHGFLVSLVNCLWITIVHIIFRAAYTANHIHEASILLTMPPELRIHPRFAMVVAALVFGVVFGLILGLFSFIASRIVKKKRLQRIKKGRKFCG